MGLYKLLYSLHLLYSKIKHVIVFLSDSSRIRALHNREVISIFISHSINSIYCTHISSGPLFSSRNLLEEHYIEEKSYHSLKTIAITSLIVSKYQVVHYFHK